MSEPRHCPPTSAPPTWALAVAERLRKAVREMSADEAEMLIAVELWYASRGITQHGE